MAMLSCRRRLDFIQTPGSLVRFVSLRLRTPAVLFCDDNGGYAFSR
jgi:hypothetical protein